ncbi:hypothetical protein D3C84_508110 [compost metagenome]
MGTSALKECAEPTGRILPGAWRTTCVNSSRFLGANRAAGRQLWPPDQLRQGIRRGARSSSASAGVEPSAVKAPMTLARCNN